MAHSHHAIDYIELPAPELPAVRDFYARAFGWQFNDYGPGYAGIRGTEEGMEAGGLAAEGTTQPLVILYSDDLDASLRAVEAAGGTVTRPPFDFPGGRRFHFTDPAGTELAVWTEVTASEDAG
jgi:predicted enzyme related to lactoylglutathione lyase